MPDSFLGIGIARAGRHGRGDRARTGRRWPGPRRLLRPAAHLLLPQVPGRRRRAVVRPTGRRVSESEGGEREEVRGEVVGAGGDEAVGARARVGVEGFGCGNVDGGLGVVVRVEASRRK